MAKFGREGQGGSDQRLSLRSAGGCACAQVRPKARRGVPQARSPQKIPQHSPEMHEPEGEVRVVSQHFVEIIEQASPGVA